MEEIADCGLNSRSPIATRPNGIIVIRHSRPFSCLHQHLYRRLAGFVIFNTAPDQNSF
jgi:hypothetical protein